MRLATLRPSTVPVWAGSLLVGCATSLMCPLRRLGVRIEAQAVCFRWQLLTARLYTRRQAICLHPCTLRLNLDTESTIELTGLLSDTSLISLPSRFTKDCPLLHPGSMTRCLDQESSVSRPRSQPDKNPTAHVHGVVADTRVMATGHRPAP